MRIVTWSCLLLLSFTLSSSGLGAQEAILSIDTTDTLHEIAGQCSFAVDDNPAYAAKDFDASGWPTIPCNKPWVLTPDFADVQGPVWYRVAIDIPNPEAVRNPALFLPLQYRGIRLYLNGRQIRETRPHNEAGETPLLPGKPEIVPLQLDQLDAGRNVIAIRTEALSYWGGLDGSMFFGPAAQLENRWMSRMIRYAGLAFVSMFVGLYFFLFFLQRREEVYTLFMALTSFALGSWILGYRGLIFFLVDQYWLYLALTFAGAILTNAFVIRFIHSFFGMRQGIFALSLEFTSYALVAALVIEFLATGLIRFFTQFLFLAFMGISLLIAVYLLIICIRAALARKTFGRRILFGFLLYTLALTYSMQDFLDIAKVEPVLSEGFFAMIVVFSTVLASRFSSMHRELERAHEDLLALDRIKDDFLANTSHELRTPLNGIIGVAESLLAGAAGTPSDAMRMNLSLIARSGRRLASLVDDILDFSRLKNRDLRINPVSVDVHPATELVFALMRPLAETKGLVLENHVPQSAPPVLVDENRLQQVLMNLVGNAIKFTEQGQVAVYAREIGGPEAAALEIEVRDTGIGIDEKDMEGVFRPFEQASGTAAREYGGAGLGLSISRQLVELHGGTVRVESIPGEGSHFFFTLPVALQAPAVKETERLVAAGLHHDNAESSVSTPANVMHPTNGYRILAVDDEPVNLQVLHNSLSVAGFQVTSAVDGRQALEVIERDGAPDLLLLDVMMPKMSGYEVCRVLRERHSLSELPILMLTARNRIQDLVTGFEVGANDYVAKPFDQKELLARVTTLLTLKDAVDSRMRLVSLQQELAIAERLQLSLLPENAPQSDSVRAAMRYQPMQKVGGDFYDFHRGADGGIGCIVADVCGHGIPAALIASMVKLSFAVHFGSAEKPAELLQGMNRMLIDMVGTNFVSAVYAYVSPQDGRVSLVNAGHPATLIHRRATGEILSLRPRGLPLGCFDDMKLLVESVELNPGDRILLFTDGVTETPNPEDVWFGEGQVESFLKRHADTALDELPDRLLEHVTGYTGKDGVLKDDLTVIALEYDGAVLDRAAAS